jgi:glycosyltransferase involved in cell wall biosynthesis
MHIIFLRGAVPPKNEHPEKLEYDHIDDCEDMWTQLLFTVAKTMGADATLLYKGPRTFVKRMHPDYPIAEMHTPSFKDVTMVKKVDLIIARGGFPYYDKIMQRFPEAKKVYYGAGKRFYPTSSFKDYDLFLTDAPAQRDAIRKKGKRAELFIKPAATMFKPIDVQKRYDVCFLANAKQRKIKRHDMLIDALDGRISALIVGNTDKKLYTQCGDNITLGGWHLRHELPKLISQCKIGVCCSTGYDSCPRVIPEYLACNLPVVVTENVNFWTDKYIRVATGSVAPNTVTGLRTRIEEAISFLESHGPRDYYDANLSMDVAAKHLVDLIGTVL